MLAIRTVVTVSILLLVSADAMANKITRLNVNANNQANPVVVVYSNNGERYTTVDPTHLTEVTVNLSARCRFSGRGNKAYKGELRLKGFVRSGKKDPANFLIPHVDEASSRFRWDGGEDQPFNPVQACNAELDKRVATSDKSKYEIMADGFNFTYPAGLYTSYAFRCNATGIGRTDLGSKGMNVDTRLRCQASPLAADKIPEKPKPKRAAIRPARQTPLLKAATFEAIPEVHTGDCPAPIEFAGTLTANRKGTVEYRYTKFDGTQSPVFKLTFDKAGTRKTRNWRTVYSKPDASKTLSMGDASGNASGGHDFSGWYRLDVLSPKPTGQIAAEYRVMCGADDRPAPEEMKFAPVPAEATPLPKRAIQVQPQRAREVQVAPTIRKAEPTRQKKQ